MRKKFSHKEAQKAQKSAEPIETHDDNSTASVPRKNVLREISLLNLLSFRRTDYFHHFNQNSTQRFAETASDARIHLHRHCDFLIGEVRHVRHVAWEETAVAVRRSHLRLADDGAESVFGFASEHRSRDTVDDLRQQIR
jgi:hypothetical protein